MNKKENEAVVNRFLLSSLYFIIGLCATYFLFKLAQNPKVMLNFNVIVWTVLGLAIIAAAISFFKKNNYYGSIFVVIALFMIVLSIYFPVIMANTYELLIAKGLTLFLNSYMPYVIGAGIMALAYIYEIVYYIINVNKK